MRSEDRSPTTRMALIGKIGAHVAHSRHDPKDTTAAARAAFRQSFEALADPDGVLSDDERARRAEQLRRAHYARLAYRSATVRRDRARQGGAEH